MTKRALTAILAAISLLSIVYISGGSIEKEISAKLLGAAIIGFGYVTGILAVAVNAVLLFVGFILSLPVISNIYSFISTMLSRIFGMLIKSTLRRFKWYRNLELRIKSTELYKRTRNFSIRGRSRKIKFLNVVECENCKKEIPSDGKFCPYCGSKTE